MKSWIKRNYNKRIVFLSCEAQKGQLILSKMSLDGISQGGRRLYDTVPLSDNLSLRHVASVLRRIIFEYTDNATPLPWPPTV